MMLLENSLTMKQLVDKDGFINSASWAQGTDYVIFTASTEAFGGIGKRLPEGRIPNMFDHHLYVMDTRTGKVTPVTADDKTSISDAEYSPADGNVYYTAENGDSVSLYRLSLKTFRSTRLAQPLECISGMSIASKGGNIMVHGSSACVPYEVWNITQASSKPRSQKILSPNDELYAGIALGTVHPWSFNSERGDKVTGFYFLPADFDSSKKYPVIVHYYGGCSPTSRRFGNGSHYPAHYWNALGYIVFIVNPSGASGFGQEWASRHVNTLFTSDLENLFVKKIIELLDKNIDKSEYGQEQLCSELCMSYITAYRKIKSLTGLTPSEFIRNFRLKRSARLALSSSRPSSISAICSCRSRSCLSCDTGILSNWLCPMMIAS